MISESKLKEGCKVIANFKPYFMFLDETSNLNFSLGS